VHWGDQDKYGHVNNVNYLRYFESGRKFGLRGRLDDMGWWRGFCKRRRADGSQRTSVGIILKSVAATYRAPVEWPDTLSIAVRVDPTTLRRDRVTQRFYAVSHAQQRIVAEGEATIVTYDYDVGRKAPIPAAVFSALKKGEGLDIEWEDLK
ncbi:thioesterase superfamily protein, partial [Blyttiomyces helicus]